MQKKDSNGAKDWWIPNKTLKVSNMIHLHWRREKSAAIKWGKWQSFDGWVQTEIAMQATVCYCVDWRWCARWSESARISHIHLMAEFSLKSSCISPPVNTVAHGDQNKFVWERNYIGCGAYRTHTSLNLTHSSNGCMHSASNHPAYYRQSTQY